MSAFPANSLCHCGSGEKYKYCCGFRGIRRSQPNDVRNPPPVYRSDVYFFPPPHTQVVGGIRRYFVGQTPAAISYIKPEHTFQDFLLLHLSAVLGLNWLEKERAKKQRKHFIAKLFDEFFLWNETARPNPQSPKVRVPNGYAREIMQLAYDVYILKHTHNWNAKYLSRLRNSSGYQGVRYEIVVAALFARLGFRLEHLKDDGGKHAEFIATHPISAERICIEAKSRHRSGIINEGGAADFVQAQRGDVLRHVNDALKQGRADMPFIIMVDLNAVPPAGTDQEHATYFNDVTRMLGSGLVSDAKGIISAATFTNFSYHYAGRDYPAAVGGMLFTADRAARPLSSNLIAALGFALNSYSVIPTS